ncbi:patatin-like phospholipase family protein [Lentisphaerota bacterium WC36G]|nr:patatin-like phospholipase family protein [Lentisphaerae bacterium WC36]
MKKKSLILMLTGLSSLILPGCSTPEKYNENDLLNAQYSISMSHVQALEKRIIPKSKKTEQNILIISGGGGFGAYGAGILNAWHEERMPNFDIITGVSTGALLATSAFINDKNSMQTIKTAYTSITRNDLVSPNFFTIWRSSYSSSAPLEKIISSSISKKMIDQVAKLHNQGRRLFVATTELNANKLTIWDMGKIANLPSEERYRLYYKILQASCSVPGFYPPVRFNYYNAKVKIDNFYSVTHCDSTKRSMFLAPWMIEKHQELKKTRVFAILNNQVINLPKREIKESFIPLFSTFIYDLINARAYFSLIETKEITLKGNVKNEYYYCSIAGDINLNSEKMDFNKKDLEKLYQAGYQDIKKKTAWKSNIPLQ